ncbi:hypothetical protein AOA14_06345 [Sphingopyxis terrae subsp. terrae NBRC 15098]|uniref:DUF736 domain-containing protein n=1 Tax=Sphingopyxis terrae subsp. terrae NBRC 15098 TaxID=1219058 RepID=A0A142VY74_9SPHN|nr:DUF736 family protein [Sphingopyxis terrae]AMU94225.1 hypothetical protein AOA14_06345 [Sphingopyxis terrae subsp. terrae NBRC 15098]
MASIGIVSGSIEKGFVGQLITLSIKAPIEIRPNRGKASDVQPDYRVWSDGVEIGAGWIRVAEQSGRPYVSLSLATPEFGPRRIYANLGRAAGQDRDNVFAIIWTPAD